MEITYRTLENLTYQEIHKCLDESFADYLLDMSYMTLEAMIYRQKLARVDLDYSVGAFDGDKMVALLIVAIDKFNGKLMAFDAGTGVIKKYRGRGIAGEMFQHSVKKLRKKNIEYFMLEVLQDNEPAIKAYEKEGFKVRREFECYDLKNGHFKNGIKELENIEIRRMSLDELENNWSLLEMEQSWEQHLNGIKIQEESLIIDGAFKDEKCLGFIVYTPNLCWLIASAAENEDVCRLLITQLVNKINPIRPFISWNNIKPDYKLGKVMKFMGFEMIVKQYEMIWKL